MIKIVRQAAKLFLKAEDPAAAESKFDALDFLAVFLASAVLLFVLVLVFFPSRLRGTVPQVVYDATENTAEKAEKAE